MYPDYEFVFSLPISIMILPKVRIMKLAKIQDDSYFSFVAQPCAFFFLVSPQLWILIINLYNTFVRRAASTN